MIIVLRTLPSDPHDNADYDYAVVKIEEPEAKILAKYLELFQTIKMSIPSLVEITFKDENVECEFYPYHAWGDDEGLPEEIEDELDDKNWAIVPDDMVLPFTPRDAHAPDSTYIVVNATSFWWHTLPDGADITIDTESLDRELLNQIL